MVWPSFLSEASRASAGAPRSPRALGDMGGADADLARAAASWKRWKWDTSDAACDVRWPTEAMKGHRRPPLIANGRREPVRARETISDVPHAWIGTIALGVFILLRFRGAVGLIQAWEACLIVSCGPRWPPEALSVLVWLAMASDGSLRFLSRGVSSDPWRAMTLTHVTVDIVLCRCAQDIHHNVVGVFL